jgi:hypothetical protein
LGKWCDGAKPTKIIGKIYCDHNGQTLDAISIKEQYDIDQERGEFMQTAKPFEYYIDLTKKQDRIF